MRQHKGKLPSYMRTAHAPKRRKITLPCSYCGLQFETRNEARKHMKECDMIADAGQHCSVCSTSSGILLPFDNLLLCPNCSVGYFQSTMVFDSPLINHMGIEYEDIFRKKVEVLLPRLEARKLSELGINVVLITFSQGMDAFRHSISPRGELVFIFAHTDQIREQEKKVFESVINHEIFHGYITHILKLDIGDKLKGPFSFMELCAARLAEDIQLEKMAVRDNLWPLLADEVSRTTLFYENAQPPISIDRWNALPDSEKLTAMTSVTWTYAVESWFVQVLNESAVKSQLNKNLKLVHPHYSQHGYAHLKDLILRLFNERIATTESESQAMVKRILAVYDEYADAHNLVLY